MEVILNNEKVLVEVIRKNNKNIYFRFKDGILVVSCNKYVSLKEIERVIYQNEYAITKLYLKDKKVRMQELQFTYLGKPYVKVFDDSVKSVLIEDDYIYAKNEKMFDKWYKNECLNVFSNRINYLLPNFDNIPKFSLRIRNMKTRWGVNNVTKCIITLNTELLKKDITLIDYVIIHELCHFYEANHSEKFWKQVSLRYPNYKEARKSLRS